MSGGKLFPMKPCGAVENPQTIGLASDRRSAAGYKIPHTRAPAMLRQLRKEAYETCPASNGVSCGTAAATPGDPQLGDFFHSDPPWLAT